MRRLQERARFLPLLALCLFLSDAAFAQYRYGGYRGAEDEGWFISIEALYANARNTDSVVATVETGTGTSTLIPDWSDEVVGRIAFGRKWASGNQLTVAWWAFDTDQRSKAAALAGTTWHVAIGPPIPDGSGGYLATTAASFNILTEIEAATADVAWSRDFEMGDDFLLAWQLGLRFADFEETYEGVYDGVGGFDPASGQMFVNKSNTSEMWGARLGFRGTYTFTSRYSIAAGVAWSFLDGETESESLLSPTGLVGGSPVSPYGFSLTDDGRSGSMRDFDVALGWHSPTNAVSVWVGWEQSVWDGIAGDLARNFPGTTALLRDRDSVTFSGAKVGVKFTF